MGVHYFLFIYTFYCKSPIKILSRTAKKNYVYQNTLFYFSGRQSQNLPPRHYQVPSFRQRSRTDDSPRTAQPSPARTVIASIERKTRTKPRALSFIFAPHTLFALAKVFLQLNARKILKVWGGAESQRDCLELVFSPGKIFIISTRHCCRTRTGWFVPSGYEGGGGREAGEGQVELFPSLLGILFSDRWRMLRNNYFRKIITLDEVSLQKDCKTILFHLSGIRF